MFPARLELARQPSEGCILSVGSRERKWMRSRESNPTFLERMRLDQTTSLPHAKAATGNRARDWTLAKSRVTTTPWPQKVVDCQ